MNPVDKTVALMPTVPLAHPLSSGSDRRLAGVFTPRSAIAPIKAASVGIMSTYPPTQCGLAQFTKSLRAGLIEDQPSLSVGIVRVGSVAQSGYDEDVTHVLSSETVAGNHGAACALNEFDIAIVQHEYGIYRGADGAQVLDILDSVRVPVLLIVHTVLANPTPGQRFILEMLTQSADAVVTMSETGRRRLLDDYRVEPRKLALIPHGAPAAAPVTRVARPGRRPVILTWGLLGPGKGIEWAISALSVMEQLPRPTYVVAGQTHPKVLARDGESYRDSLAEQAERRGVAHLMDFQPGYFSAGRLRELLAEADVVLLPYDSQEQVTSGVLTEAMAAGVPVVSTAFPHAAELLANGRGGLLVPHKDPAAIAAALTRIINEPGLARAMSAHNASLTAAMTWPAVASQYRQLLDALLRRSAVSGR